MEKILAEAIDKILKKSSRKHKELRDACATVLGPAPCSEFSRPNGPSMRKTARRAALAAPSPALAMLIDHDATSCHREAEAAHRG